MPKFIVKETDIYKITVQTSLKVGDSVRVNLPKTYPAPLNTVYITTIADIKGEMLSGNKIMVKTAIYPKWMDIHYVLEIL